MEENSMFIPIRLPGARINDSGCFVDSWFRGALRGRALREYAVSQPQSGVILMEESLTALALVMALIIIHRLVV